MPDLRSEIRTRLNAGGLQQHADALLRLARPAIRLEPRRCAKGELAIGSSRFGGAPDLPDGFVWPTFEGRHHTFIAQVDLAEVPGGADLGLPPTGSLAFFYETESMRWGFDPADRGCARVAHFDGPLGALRRTALPVRDTGAFAPCALRFAGSLDLPDPFDLLCENARLRMTEDQLDAYAEATRDEALWPERYHHLLGHPQLIQNDMRQECQLAANGVHCGEGEGHRSERAAALLPGATDWELLLQVDTDENGPGWMWGDVGRIYYWIRREDLARRRFDRSWLILQCC